MIKKATILNKGEVLNTFFPGSGSNYPYFEDLGYTMDANIANAEDGDSHFDSIGTPRSYTITINALEDSISLEQVSKKPETII